MDHVFEKLAYVGGKNLCEPIEKPKKYFVAKDKDNPYRAYSRKRFCDPIERPKAWFSKIMFESDDYSECQQKAKELNKVG